MTRSDDPDRDEHTQTVHASHDEETGIIARPRRRALIEIPSGPAPSLDPAREPRCWTRWLASFERCRILIRFSIDPISVPTASRCAATRLRIDSARVHRDRRPRSRAIPRPHCRSSPPPCPSSAGCARKFSRYIRLRSFAGANEYGVCVPTHPQSGQAGGRLARRKELALANASANAQAGATPATPEDRESAQSTASEPNGASAQPHTADDVCRALEQLLWR